MATALVAGDFDVTKVALDPQENVVIGHGTITLNDDYAADTWLITPAFLGLKSIGCLALAGNMAAAADTTDNIFVLEKTTTGYYLQAFEGLESTGWVANDDVDGFDGDTVEIFFIGTGAVVAPA